MKDLLNRNIRKIRKELKDKNQDEWLKKERVGEGDTNEYFWFHNGEEKFVEGKLEALIKLREQIKNNKS